MTSITVPLPHYSEHNLSHHSISTLRLCFLSKTFRRAICVSSALFSNFACTLLGICVSHQRHYHDGDSLARNPKWETTSNPTGRLLLCWCHYEKATSSNLMFSSVYAKVSVTHPTSTDKEIDLAPPAQPNTYTHTHKSQIISPFLHHSCCLTRIGPVRFLLRKTHWPIRKKYGLKTYFNCPGTPRIVTKFVR